MKELFTEIDIFSAITLSILLIPILISISFLFATGKGKRQENFVLILSGISLLLIGVNSRFTNLRGLNKSVTIVEKWRSGMPKGIKYNEYGNKEHVITISYHENGNMSNRVEYENGVKSGNEITFNQNSSTKKIKNFVNGELIAEYSYEDFDSHLKRDMQKLFEDSDNENQSENYKLIEQISNLISPCCPQNYVLTKYHENGNIKSKEMYINGKLNGRTFFYFPDGNIKEQGNKFDFEKSGKWEYFNEIGELIKIEIYDETGLLVETKKIN